MSLDMDLAMENIRQAVELRLGVRILRAYLKEKQAMGMLVLSELPSDPHTEVLVVGFLHAGSYIEVIEPWLKQFVRDHPIHCKVEASSPYACGSLVVLQHCPVDYEVVVTLKVTSCGRGEGMVMYV